jgi:hypothetical protein
VRARVRTDSFTRIRVRATTLRMHVAQIYELAGNGYPVATADDAIGFRDGLASNGSFASVLSISQWAFSLRIPLASLASQLRRAAHGFVRVRAHAPSPRPHRRARLRRCVRCFMVVVRSSGRLRALRCLRLLRAGGAAERTQPAALATVGQRTQVLHPTLGPTRQRQGH